MADPLDYQARGAIHGRGSRTITGLVRARVVDNNDPEQRCRLQLLIPEVSGNTAAHPEWARPAAGLPFGKGDGGRVWGAVDLPEPGDVVWVEFVRGDPQHPAWLPGWAIDGAVPSLLLEHYPHRRGRVTPSGHALYFDDSDGDDGDVVLQHRDGGTLQFSGNGDAVFTSKSGVTVTLRDGGNEIDVTVGTGGTVNLNAETVNVGRGADSFFVRWTEFVDWASRLTLATPIGPTLVTPAQVPPANMASTAGKVK